MLHDYKYKEALLFAFLDENYGRKRMIYQILKYSLKLIYSMSESIDFF